MGAALVSWALLLLATVAGHTDPLPYAAPLFLLTALLLAGRYVGEERLARMRSGLRRAPLRAPRAEAPPAVRRPAASLPRGDA